MWLALSFLSAFLLGFYDASKKAALKDNAVIPVLLLNTLFSTMFFSPVIADSALGIGLFDLSAPVDMPLMKAHLLTFCKSVIVLSSWILGYFGLKHLPITIVGPINATRPILVLLGAMIVFGERLNLWQWAGVILAMISLYLLSRSSKKEKIDFAHDKWEFFVAASAMIGAFSGLYDKYIMRQLNPLFVQGWYNLYQLVLMSVICMTLWYPKRKTTTPFHWSWAILLISVFISLADFAYYLALSKPDSMISVVSLVRRSSVIVSFICGAVVFKEKNLKAKALDLAFILVGMVCIWMGTK